MVQQIADVFRILVVEAIPETEDGRSCPQNSSDRGCSQCGRQVEVVPRTVEAVRGTADSRGCLQNRSGGGHR